MPMTNFPYGFADGLSVRGMPLLQAHPGNVFWVDNALTNSPYPNADVAGSDSNRGTYQRPFASLAMALSMCQSGNGDIIFIKPGHQETVTGAGTITQTANSNYSTLSLNVGSVAIIGLGTGISRPTFNFTTAATANIPLRAAGVSIQNVLFTANYADIASVFTAQVASVTASISGTTMTVTVVGSGTLYPGAIIRGTGILPNSQIISQLSGTTGGVGTYQISLSQTFASGTITTTVDDFNIENCTFRDSSSILNFISIVTGASGANAIDGLRFANNRITSLGTTAATTAIKPLSATDRMSLVDNFGNWAVLNNTATLLAGGANNLTNLEVGRNRVNRPNTSTTSGVLISSSSTACTGHVYDNYAWHLASSGLLCNTGTKLAFSNNFCPITGAADKSGLINPAAV